MHRRRFLATGFAGVSIAGAGSLFRMSGSALVAETANPGEDLIADVQRVRGQCDDSFYRQHCRRKQDASGKRDLCRMQNKVLIQRLREDGEQSDTQIVISDGLNVLAVTDGDQLVSLVRRLRKELAGSGFRVAPTNVVVDAGRVRAGYRIDEQRFGGRKGRFTILHVIGERPGSGHHTLSIYMTVADGDVWGEADKVDHNITKVVSGIAGTALTPDLAAIEAAKILRKM